MNYKKLAVLIIFNLVAMAVVFAGDIAPRDDIAGLKNFAKVTDNIYRGAQPTAQGFKELKKMGVKTIVNLRVFHSDISLLKGLGFNYYHLSFKTWHPEDEDVAQFLKVATNPSYYPLFVHCQHGSDRTGMMIAIYRIYAQGWTATEAMQELPVFGYHKIWRGIKNYLINFDKEKMRERLEKTKEPAMERIN